MRTTIGLRLGPEERRKLDTLAGQLGTTRGAVLRRLLMAAILETPPRVVIGELKAREDRK